MHMSLLHIYICQKYTGDTLIYQLMLEFLTYCAHEQSKHYNICLAIGQVSFLCCTIMCKELKWSSLNTKTHCARYVQYPHGFASLTLFTQMLHNHLVTQDSLLSLPILPLYHTLNFLGIKSFNFYYCYHHHHHHHH